MSIIRKRLAGISVLLPAALLVAGFSAPAQAEFFVTAQSSTAVAGGAGSFDVVASNTGSTAVDVGGFSLELQVASGSGVTFTGADVATTAAPYLYGTLQAPPLTFATFPTFDFIASDSDQAAPGFVSIPLGASFGLEHISYTVAPGTVGPITVSIVGLTGAAPTTEIDDVNGTPISFTPVNGTITLLPEPGAMTLCGGVSLMLMFMTRRRGSVAK